MRAAVFAVVMAIAFHLLSPLEHRPLPWWDGQVHPTGARATATGVLLCLAGAVLVLMAKSGLSGVVGWAALGCFLVAVFAARVCAGRAAGRAAR